MGKRRRAPKVAHVVVADEKIKPLLKGTFPTGDIRMCVLVGTTVSLHVTMLASAHTF